ncbi:MarR family winged helix-turn-helix transcriptional regulator [Methylobacterium nigriterrae]|uniref:MarR family winged helix-turn-helix transcriptional regulator n=1 Tax=Methylobacterium nigriterrae TaxID=3127512 RepID=UPI003013F069
MARTEDPTLAQADYAALAAFRQALRRFLAFSKAAARRAGLPPQQHQALLAIKGAEPPVSVGQLAESLIIAPHTAAELADRLDAAGLVTRSPSAADRRRVELALTEKAEGVLRTLSEAHRTELRAVGPLLRELLQAIEGGRREAE